MRIIAAQPLATKLNKTLNLFNMVDVYNILSLHKNTTVNWHEEVKLTNENHPWKSIEENHMWNFCLWHEEDVVRIKDLEAIRIVEAKRNIDRFNQLRNDAIEKIDEWVLFYLSKSNIMPGEKMHSETPGMMIDRLSIMSLKRYHMLEETLRPDALEEHKAICRQKALILDDQINDLANCLASVLSLLEAGKLKFKVYRQFKMYNDPNLNPELYMRNQKSV
jgi:hypothetical protein